MYAESVQGVPIESFCTVMALLLSVYALDVSSHVPYSECIYTFSCVRT